MVSPELLEALCGVEIRFSVQPGWLLDPASGSTPKPFLDLWFYGPGGKASASAAAAHPLAATAMNWSLP